MKTLGKINRNCDARDGRDLCFHGLGTERVVHAVDVFAPGFDSPLEHDEVDLQARYKGLLRRSRRVSP